MSSPNLSFLLVEDDELDVEAIHRALRKSPIDAPVQTASDGAKALDALRESVANDESTRPIVLLDLNMPGMNGHEFLAELRADSELRTTIVFVLTSSDHNRDIHMAYEKHVAGYFLKSEIVSFIETLAHYVTSVKYPGQRAVAANSRSD